MPPVMILSPYSGRPVKIREQDLGRAVRDEEGRVFYVVEDPDHGRYAARTRKGSDKDLQRYRDLQAKTGKLDEAPAVQAARHANVHDATGTKRRNPAGLMVLLLLVLLAAAAGYVYFAHPGLLGLDGGDDARDQTAPDRDAGAASGAYHSGTGSLQTVRVSFGFPEREQDPPIDMLERAIELAERSEASSAGIESVRQADVAAPVDDPKPVIVPARTWRAEASPAPVETATDTATDTAVNQLASENKESEQAGNSDESKTKADNPNGHSDPGDLSGLRHTATGLRYKITKHTDGPAAKAGNYITVRYTARDLEGQTLIDQADQSFVLMSGQAIRAFDEGLAGIRESEHVRLFVPRGHSASGILPGIKRVPDQPFLLDVQLVSIRPGVTYIVEQPGTVERDTASPGDTVAVHYVARVEGHSDIFDATSPRGEPMRITLGSQEVIPGLELGLTGMRTGETRLLTIPPYLAYGDRPVAGGLIPADAVLSFRVMLVDIAKPQAN